MFQLTIFFIKNPYADGQGLNQMQFPWSGGFDPAAAAAASGLPNLPPGLPGGLAGLPGGTLLFFYL